MGENAIGPATASATGFVKRCDGYVSHLAKPSIKKFVINVVNEVEKGWKLVCMTAATVVMHDDLISQSLVADLP